MNLKVVHLESFHNPLQYYCMLYNSQNIKFNLWIQLIKNILKEKPDDATRMQDRILVQLNICNTPVLITILYWIYSLKRYGQNYNY